MRKLFAIIAMLACASALAVPPKKKPDLVILVSQSTSVMLRDSACVDPAIKEMAVLATQMLGAPLADKYGEYVHEGKRGYLCYKELKDGYWVIDDQGGYGFINKTSI